MDREKLNDKVVKYLEFIESNLHLLNDYSKQFLLSLANDVDREW
jgi:hypothetical protein